MPHEVMSTHPVSREGVSCRRVWSRGQLFDSADLPMGICTTIGITLAVIGAILRIAEGAGTTWGRRWY